MIMTHLTLLGLKIDQVKDIIMTIEKWKHNNGIEWTVGRIKDLKTWYIQHLAGHKEFTPEWFRFHVRNGETTPKGPFGALFGVRNQTDKQIIKSLSILMVYTAFRLPQKKASKKQIIKTLGSIQGQPLDKEVKTSIIKTGSKLKKNLSIDALKLVRIYVSKRDKGFNFVPVSLNTGKPFTTGKEKYLNSFLQGLHIPLLKDYFESYFVDFPKECKFPINPADFNEFEKKKLNMPLAGSLVLLQEAGAKARVIANPNSAAQVALHQLHVLLDSMLLITETDCTHNQEEGAFWAQTKLDEGNTVYSVDLSGATDNFPLELQLSLLNSLGLKSEADLIRSLATGIWMLGDSLKTDLLNGGYQQAITYTKGQPQGLYSSFPLFGLTHNLIVNKMCETLGIIPHESFRILGDDIVLINTKLHDMYREYMQKIGVPISEDKSVHSDSLAEFAGFIITRNGCYKPAKVPKHSGNVAYENNFMNYLQVVGYKGLKNLPSKVRTVARKAAELPEEYGGLGFNPHGLSINDRLKDFVFNEDVLDIPRYNSMTHNFTVVNASNEARTPDEVVVLDWLYDQYNLYELQLETVIVEYVESNPTSLQYISHTELHGIAYQWSLQQGYTNGNFLIGNKHPDELEDKPFKTAFQQWKVRFDPAHGYENVLVSGFRANLKLHSDKPFKPAFKAGSKKVV